MSLHEFGNSVEEIQRKLADILPLVDAGQNRAHELHEALADELGDYDDNYQRLEAALGAMDEVAAEIDEEVSQVQGDVAVGLQEFGEGAEELAQQADEALAQLVSAQEQVESQLEQLHSQLASAAGELGARFSSLVESANSLQDLLAAARQSAAETFAELSESVNRFASQWADDENASAETLETLQSALAEGHSPQIGELFSVLQEGVDGVAAGLAGLIEKHEGGMGEFFAAFDADARSLADDFQNRAAELFHSLKDYAVNEIGESLGNAFENLIKESVEAFAAEIIECVVTSQLGVATTTALAPVIPELVVAKKVTGLINSIL